MRLSWPFFQLLSARKYIVPYLIVKYPHPYKQGNDNLYQWELRIFAKYLFEDTYPCISVSDAAIWVNDSYSE